MFGRLLGGGKHSKSPASERVISLSQQGYSEPEIIRSLRKEGYSPFEAETAMRTAVRDTALNRPYEANEPPKFPPSDFPEKEGLGLPEIPRPSTESTSDQYIRGGNRRFEPPRFESRPERSSQLFPDEEELPQVGRGSGPDMEEVAEGLFQEKWGTFEKEIDDISSRISAAEERIRSVEAAITEFKGVRKGDIEVIKQSIDSYKDSISEVSSRIEGMERALKDSLTPMMQSLRSLSETLRDMKKVSKP